jgi:hypothetical protein
MSDDDDKDRPGMEGRGGVLKAGHLPRDDGDPLTANVRAALKRNGPRPTRRLTVADLQDPWYERQDQETDGEWRAFVVFRDLDGVRTLADVAAELDVKETTVGHVSARCLWFERARAWDSEVDRQRRAAYLSRVREMGERHADQAQNAGAALMLPFAALAKAMQDKGQDGILDLLATAENRGDVVELLRLCRQVAIPLTNVQRAERLALTDKPEDVSDDAGRHDPVAERIAANPEAVEQSHQVLIIIAQQDQHAETPHEVPADFEVVESVRELADASEDAGDDVEDD